MTKSIFRGTIIIMEQIVRKNGLLYTPDLHTVLGVDIETGEFKGRVPFGAHYIDEEVFTECPYEKIDLPDSVVAIGAALFKDSKNLKSVRLPEKATELPPYLFSGCSALTRVKMPNVVYDFPEGLFQNCSSMTEIPFRAGIKSLSPFIFEGCTSLVSLVIPPTVERIEKRAAAGCTALTTLVLPVSLQSLDETAFDECPNIRSIRISEDNPLFYVSEEDGCLYERTATGDKLRLSVAGAQPSKVSFLKENVDDEEDPEIEAFYTDEDILEDDDDFSAEVSGDDVAEQAVAQEAEEEEEEQKFHTGTVSNEELANLFGGSEGDGTAVPESVEGADEEVEIAAVTVKITDSKTQAILDSVEFYKVIECEPAGEPPSDSDLFVVAEILEGQADARSFTPKLEVVSRRFAQIKDFKRIFMLYGLPVDNDEFMELYKLYVSNSNVVFACQAANATSLSDYGRKICEYSRIGLSAAALAEQKQNVRVKNAELIKLIIQDKE